MITVFFFFLGRNEITRFNLGNFIRVAYRSETLVLEQRGTLCLMVVSYSGGQNNTRSTGSTDIEKSGTRWRYRFIPLVGQIS